MRPDPAVCGTPINSDRGLVMAFASRMRKRFFGSPAELMTTLAMPILDLIGDRPGVNKPQCTAPDGSQLLIRPKGTTMIARYRAVIVGCLLTLPLTALAAPSPELIGDGVAGALGSGTAQLYDQTLPRWPRPLTASLTA
jgi:hypothetical protein